MNHHELADVATVRLGALLAGERRFFSRSVDSPPLLEVANNAGATVDDITRAGQRTVTVETPLGPFEAAFMPWQWLGAEYPTLVYHHGSGERPFDFGRFSSNSVRRLFAGPDIDVPANIVVVRAPFHDGSNREYVESMGELTNFVGMLAAASGLTEALVGEIDQLGSTPVVSGISLGGWVTNLHRVCFGSADRYVPLLAGAALGEMFVTSAYRHLTADSALARPGRLRETLDFAAEFRAIETDDCRPLLARYDRIIEFDTQRPCYECSVRAIEKGHVTGSLASDVLREHILDAIGSECGLGE